MLANLFDKQGDLQKQFLCVFLYLHKPMFVDVIGRKASTKRISQTNSNRLRMIRKELPGTVRRSAFINLSNEPISFAVGKHHYATLVFVLFLLI